MINPYTIITEHEGNYEFIFDQYFFVAIFKPIWEAYDDKGTATKIIKYIVYGFSMHSDKITVTGDRRKELEAIFNWLEIDKAIYTDVVLLQKIEIVDCCKKWMDFQDSAQLEYLLTLKQCYIQQQTASLSPLKKADGLAIDFDQKFKCVEHMKELKAMIKEAEQELIQNNAKLKEAYKEVGADNTKTNTKGKGIEQYLREK